MRSNEELEKMITTLSAKVDEHETAITELKAAAPSAVSSITKAAKVEKPKVCDTAAEVTYKDKAGKEQKGKFKFLHPTVHKDGTGEIITAEDAIKETGVATLTWYVQNTWVGSGGKSKFVSEVV